MYLFSFVYFYCVNYFIIGDGCRMSLKKGKCQWVVVGSIEHQHMLCSGWKEAGLKRDWCGPHDAKLTTVLMEKKEKIGNLHYTPCSTRLT